MSFLTRFLTADLAIDLGTVNTLIYAPQKGIVLNEPSAVAVYKYSGEVISVGREAAKLIGREPQDTAVYRPIHDGSIENFEVTQKMLRAFISRVLGKGSQRTRLVVAVPGSSSLLEQRTVRDAARDIKATEVELVDEGLAAAFGSGLEAMDERAHLVVDIGGGTTSCTIVSSGAVVLSLSLKAAGNAMDEAIRDYMRSRHDIQIGERTAEELKKDLGRVSALSSNGISGDRNQTEVIGKTLTDGMARAVEIGPDEVRQALEPILEEIINGTRRVIEESQADVTADIFHTGILLAGGGSLLNGIVGRFEKDLRLKVRMAADPLSAVALGAGKLLMDQQLLRRVAIRRDMPVWQAAE
ncbi:MAG: rod shape-determining protein [Pyrinomonadaceae bacterium]